MHNPRILSEGSQSFDGLDRNRLEIDENFSQNQAISWLEMNTFNASGLEDVIRGKTPPHIFLQQTFARCPEELSSAARAMIVFVFSAFVMQAGCGAANVQAATEDNKIHIIEGDKPIDVKVAQPESPEPEKKLTQEDLDKTLLRYYKYSNLVGIKKALDDGADVNARDGYGDTVLTLRTNLDDITKYLIEKGADVNARNNRGITPLAFAAMSNHIEKIKLLIEKDVDVNARDNEGMTPLAFAAKSNNIEMIELLIKNGADVNARSNDGQRIMDWVGFNEITGYVSYEDSTEVIKLLKSYKAKRTKDSKSIKNLPKIGTTWTTMLMGTMNNFKNDTDGENRDINPGNYLDINWEKQNIFENAILRIANSPKLVSKLYKWALPIIKEWNESISPEVQSEIQFHLEQTIQYAQNFSKERDEERFVKREEGWGHQLESFWFRRFDNGLNRKVVLKYARKLLKDISD